MPCVNPWTTEHGQNTDTQSPSASEGQAEKPVLVEPEWCGHWAPRRGIGARSFSRYRTAPVSAETVMRVGIIILRKKKALRNLVEK
jgi:hypothetical protein